MLGPFLDVGASFGVAGARDSAPCQKWANVRVLWNFQKRWQAWDIWRGFAKMHFAWHAQYNRDMFIRDVRRSGQRFPERGCILEHQIVSFGKMILRDRCSTSYDLASLFRGRCSTLDRWSGKIAKRIGTRPSALHSTFQFLQLSGSKMWDVSQNSFVFTLADRQIDT